MKKSLEKEEVVKKLHYDSGELEWKTPFVNGQIHGVEKWYYKSGRLKRETHFANGKRHGVQKEYNSEGKVVRVKNYKNDVLVSVYIHFS